MSTRTPPAPPAALADWPFIHWVEVRFRDLDALGHVNNAVYLTYLESARIEFYMSLMPVPITKIGIVLAEITVTYRAPAFFDDLLAVGVRVATMGSRSFTLEYQIVRSSDDVLVATARSTLVAYDFEANRSIPVSTEFRAAVERLQGAV